MLVVDVTVLDRDDDGGVVFAGVDDDGAPVEFRLVGPSALEVADVADDQPGDLGLDVPESLVRRAAGGDAPAP